jgi:RHS repeat-associated protein
VAGGSVQPYRHTGHEMQAMHGLNWIDNGARFRTVYDGGSFTTRDPMAEKYYSISPYAYCGNNPVNRIDPNGMEWKTKEDEEYARSLSQEMTNRMNSEQKSLDNLNAKIAQNQEKGKDVSKDQAKAAGMQENIDNLKTGVSELTAMGDTKDQVFTYNKIDGDVGKTKIENGVIVMNVAGNGNTTNGVHESSHGYDVWKKGMPKEVGSLYDTEIKAYGRQYSFGGQSAMPQSDGGTVKSFSNITPCYILGIQDGEGGYMYAPSIIGPRYSPAYVKSIIKQCNP